MVPPRNGRPRPNSTSALMSTPPSRLNPAHRFGTSWASTPARISRLDGADCAIASPEAAAPISSATAATADLTAPFPLSSPDPESTDRQARRTLRCPQTSRRLYPIPRQNPPWTLLEDEDFCLLETHAEMT